MELNITGRHCTIPDTVRERVGNRTDALERVEPRLDSCIVNFVSDHGVKRAEVRVHVAGAHQITAHGSGPTFVTAFDRAYDRLGRQLKRRREQRREFEPVRLSEFAPGA